GWTAEEAQIYRDIMTWTKQRAKESGVPPGFAMQMPLRQAASCLPAVLQLLRERNPDLAAAAAVADFDEVGDDVSGWLDDGLRVVAAGARAPRCDSKLDAFVAMLDDARRSGLGQVMVFSFFIRTLDDLRTQLDYRDWKVCVMHGGTKPRDRERLMQEF